MICLTLATEVRKFQPLNVAEILTVRQILVLRIHAHSTLEVTSLLWSKCCLKDEVVAITANHLQRLNREYALLALLIDMYIYLFEGYSIIESLLVNNITKSVLLSCLDAC